MKKLIFAFTVILSVTVEAQNITDAVRYSSTDLNGTARYRAMSGAFGALGGDLSSLNVNPAGSAVFLNSFATFSLNVENAENEITYRNGFNSNSASDVDLGQAGAVFVFNNRDENASWRKFSLGFNYNKSASFEDDLVAFGTNNKSINDYFLNYTSGVPVDLLESGANNLDQKYADLGERYGFGAQQAFLGYQGYLFDYLPENSSSPFAPYTSNIASGSFDQEYVYAATGLNGKFSFNFATQYQDNLYLGLNLNSHFINYDRVTTFFEANSNSGSEINEIYFEDRLNTLGSGFSFQLGALGKLGENVRVGAAYESPTWYTISEETTQYLETYSEEFGEAIVDPQVVNIYPDYKLQTPSKYTGSLAYLFGSSALISFDYSYKDYSSTKFKPKDDPAFINQNDILANDLRGASEFRLGGEYRLDAWSLRAGYRFEESPYTDDYTIGDLQGYSAGIGYNFGNVRLDLSYDAWERESNPQLYQTGLTDRININRNNSNFILSLSFGI